MPVPPIGCRVFTPPTWISDRRGTGDFLLFPFWETVSNVISTIVVQNTPFISASVDYSSWLFRISVDVFRQKVTFSSDKMLTDMTPTAGQLYGAQIPAMTMNVKTAVSIAFLYFRRNRNVKCNATKIWECTKKNLFKSCQLFDIFLKASSFRSTLQDFWW